MTDRLIYLPLGGAGEVGMNFMSTATAPPARNA